MAKKKVVKKSSKAAAKPGKIAAASKPRSKSELFGSIADATGMAKKDVASVFEGLTRILSADLSKSGPGAVTIPGLMKVRVLKKPAQKARMGRKPGGAPGEMVMFKAKPARNVVKVRPLTGLKSMV